MFGESWNEKLLHTNFVLDIFPPAVVKDYDDENSSTAFQECLKQEEN